MRDHLGRRRHRVEPVGELIALRMPRSPGASTSGRLELEHQEHVRAPLAEALDRDQLGDHGRRRRARRGGRARASRRARARRASAGSRSSRARGRRRRAAPRGRRRAPPPASAGGRRSGRARAARSRRAALVESCWPTIVRTSAGVVLARARGGRGGGALGSVPTRSISAPSTGSAARRCASRRAAHRLPLDGVEQLLEARELDARAPVRLAEALLVAVDARPSPRSRRAPAGARGRTPRAPRRRSARGRAARPAARSSSSRSTVSLASFLLVPITPLGPRLAQPTTYSPRRTRPPSLAISPRAASNGHVGERRAAVADRAEHGARRDLDPLVGRDARAARRPAPASSSLRASDDRLDVPVAADLDGREQEAQHDAPRRAGAASRAA